MNKSTAENFSPELQPNSEQKMNEITSSPTIGTSVVISVVIVL